MTSFQQQNYLKKADRYTNVKEQITAKWPTLARLNSGCASPLDIDHLHLKVNTETSQFPASLQMTKKNFFRSFCQPKNQDIQIDIIFKLIDLFFFVVS